MTSTAKNENPATYDVVVIGAGFAGLYALHRLRKMGCKTIVYERGDGVGGTWYWNRYPGARCDIESLAYSYSFSEELQREWKWSHRYAAQPEILAYLNHVADRFDLRKDIQFNTTVQSATYDEERRSWTVGLADGSSVVAQFVIMATGPLSSKLMPKFKGLETFKGRAYHTGDWPHEGVNFAGKRVGVIGTGSSAIQSIPIIAKEAKHLTVFQRTAQFAIPAWNRPLDDKEMREMQENYGDYRRLIRESIGGVPFEMPEHGAVEDTPEEREKVFDFAWKRGGYIMIAAYPDIMTNAESNKLVGEWVKTKLRERIKDPKTAEMLMPNYKFATKRLCVDTNYYETYNRDNVDLISIKDNPIDSVVPEGVRLADGTAVELDIIVFATGFDAMTGAMLAIEIKGRGGLALRDKWAGGADNYLGLTISGFPNMFMVNGPGSPSVLYNMVPGIEQHVDWISDCIDYMRKNGIMAIEADPDREAQWTHHVDEIARQTLYPEGNSWYMGRNIPGKPQRFMPYAAGGPPYHAVTDKIAAQGYRTFRLEGARQAAQ